MDYEDVLSQVGDFGKYQKIFVLLFLMPTAAINILYDFMFMMYTPDHWCYVPELANLTYEQQSKLIRPHILDQGIDVKDKCNMFDIDYSIVSRTLRLPDHASNHSTKPCEFGWVYDKSVFVETATTKFDLVCDKSYLVSTLLSIGCIGIVIATPIISFISDWIGRKKAFFLVLMIFTISCISPIILRDMVSFALSRFFGYGMLNVYFQIPFVMVIESVGPIHRTKVSCFSAIAYALGSCILPIVAYLTHHWVYFSAVQLGLTIPFFFAWKFLPESAPWLVTQGRYKEAYECVKKIAKMNGKPVPADLMLQLQRVGAKQAESKATKQTDSTWDLILVPELRKFFVILTLIFASNTIAYAGLAMNTLNFHGSEFINYFLLALVDMPALFLGWYLLEGRLGRRWSNCMFLLICGISLCLPILIPPSEKMIITIMSLFGKFGTAASYMIIYQQAAELYPTTLRSQGIGISTTFSAATGICVPFITYLGRYGIWIPMFIMGSVCLIVGIASSFLPETLNEYLPQNTSEAKKFGKNKKYFSLAKTKLKHETDKVNEILK